METILSILLYFIFFYGCFLAYKSGKVTKGTTILVVLLFLFLCFGYMTGSDWRNYELVYHDSKMVREGIAGEKGFYFLNDLFNRAGVDFFVFIALLKCIYLFSVVFLLRKITDKWLPTLGVMFTTSLLFMLIDNPLRFMVACIFVNFGLIQLLNDNYKKFLYISICAPLFHTSTLFIILIAFIKKLLKPVVLTNNNLLFIIYVVTALIMSSVSNATFIREYAETILSFLGMKSYEGYYEVENNDVFFSIGSLIRIVLAYIVIYNRDIIIREPHGKSIFELTVLCLFLSRVVLLIPSGFRLTVPFTVFYSISLAIIICNKKAIQTKVIIMSIMSIMLFRTLYNSYVYIPYSNSIYYIVTNHKSYNERFLYNISAYEERKGVKLRNNNTD